MKETGPRRRPYGTGSLFVCCDAWYAKWYVGSRQVKRKVGARRTSPRDGGLTKAEAERELRRLMRVTRATPLERLTLRGAGNAYIAHLRDFLERKPSTADYAPDPVQGARWAEAAFSETHSAAWSRRAG